VLPLLGRSVSPLLRVDPALESALDVVVADPPGRVDAVGDVLIGRSSQEAGLGCVISPNAGQAVRLQLGADRVALRAGLLATAFALERAEQVLDVVTVFMREDVGFGERSATSAEAGP